MNEDRGLGRPEVGKTECWMVGKLESWKVVKCAHRLLRLGASENIHPGLLHHREEFGVVVAPAHVPHVLALEAEVHAGRGGVPTSFAWDSRQVEKSQHPVDVDDAEFAAGAVQRHDLRTAT